MTTSDTVNPPPELPDDRPATSPSGGAATGDKGMLAGLDPHLKRLAAVVVLGSIMSILDTTIVNVAIDTLSKDFHAPLSTVQWVSTGYLLALAMTIPLTGWAVERFGAKTMWIASLTLFLLGSALSGAAWSIQSLIVFRVLQGVGGGMIMPIGQSIMATAAGPQRMGRVMSLLGVPMLLGPVLGPVIGGLILDSVSWRWIFYVNIPIGIVAVALAAKILPGHQKTDRNYKLDVLGLCLLSPGLGLFVYGLSQAGQGSPVSVWLPMVLGAVFIGAFVLHALRAKVTPLIEVLLFRNVQFAAAAATTFCFGAALFGGMLLLPLYYQAARGQTPLTAGLLMAPQGIGAALVMPLGGKLTDRYGAGRVVPAGLVVVTLATIVYTQLGAHTSFAVLAVSLFVRGIGFGFVMMPAISAAYQTLSAHQVPRASTAINIVQRVGGSIGTALVAVVLDHQITMRVPGLTGGLSGMALLSPAEIARDAAPVASAFGATFWWAVGMTALALVPGLFLARSPRSAGRAEAPVLVD
ncbi:MAG: DHA2 family efflux MFS transporter permease subunit [Acidimicrobiales bacterium]|jgi:EmrB/QacA subfamily drug resistance transporter